MGAAAVAVAVVAAVAAVVAVAVAVASGRSFVVLCHRDSNCIHSAEVEGHPDIWRVEVEDHHTPSSTAAAAAAASSSTYRARARSSRRGWARRVPVALFIRIWTRPALLRAETVHGGGRSVVLGREVGVGIAATGNGG